jgi:hypothetical protein
MKAWKKSNNEPLDMTPQQTIDGVTIYRIESECLENKEDEEVFVETLYDYQQRYLDELDTGISASNTSFSFWCILYSILIVHISVSPLFLNFLGRER